MTSSLRPRTKRSVLRGALGGVAILCGVLSCQALLDTDRLATGPTLDAATDAISLSDAEAGTSVDAADGRTLAPTVLAEEQPNALYIVANDTTVYWSDGAAISSCALAGCGGKPSVVVSAPAMDFVVLGSDVVWIENGVVHAKAMNDAGVRAFPTPEATDFARELAAVDQSAALVVLDKSGVFDIRRCVTAGQDNCYAGLMISYEQAPVTQLAWLPIGPSYVLGSTSFVRCIGNDCTVSRTSVADESTPITAIASDAVRAYWSTAEGIFSKVVPDGARTALVPGESGVVALHAADNRVYFTSATRVGRVGVLGGEVEELAKVIEPRGMAVTAGHVAWIEGKDGTVRAMPKP